MPLDVSFDTIPGGAQQCGSKLPQAGRGGIEFSIDFAIDVLLIVSTKTIEHCSPSKSQLSVKENQHQNGVCVSDWWVVRYGDWR